MVCAPNCSVACLRAFGRRRPLEIFAQTALYLAGKNPAKATQIHAFAEKAVTASRAISHEFRDGIDGYFFDGDAGLAKRDQTLRFFLMRLVGFSVSRSRASSVLIVALIRATLFWRQILMMLLTGPVIGAASGIVLGLFAFIASKLVRH